MVEKLAKDYMEKLSKPDVELSIHEEQNTRLTSISDIGKWPYFCYGCDTTYYCIECCGILHRDDWDNPEYVTAYFSFQYLVCDCENNMLSWILSELISIMLVDITSNLKESFIRRYQG